MQPLELAQCIVHEPPPRLPADQFPAEFVDFTARCVWHSMRTTPSRVHVCRRRLPSQAVGVCNLHSLSAYLDGPAGGFICALNGCRCLVAEPSHRQSPEDLMLHPYFAAYASIEAGDPELVSLIVAVMQQREEAASQARAVNSASAAAEAASAPPAGGLVLSPEPGSTFFVHR